MSRVIASKALSICGRYAHSPGVGPPRHCLRRRSLPSASASSRWSPAAIWLWWSILAELALGLVILLAVGALGITSVGADE
jgi:hypothetical protein